MFAKAGYTHCLPDVVEVSRESRPQRLANRFRRRFTVDQAATLLIHVGVCEASLRRQARYRFIMSIGRQRLERTLRNTWKHVDSLSNVLVSANG